MKNLHKWPILLTSIDYKLKYILRKSETTSYDRLPKMTTFHAIVKIPLYVKLLKATTSQSGHNELNVKPPKVTISLNGHKQWIEILKYILRKSEASSYAPSGIEPSTSRLPD